MTHRIRLSTWFGLIVSATIAVAAVDIHQDRTSRESVLVVTHQLGRFETLSNGSVELRMMPSEALPSDPLTDTQTALDRVLLRDVEPGTILNENDLASEEVASADWVVGLDLKLADTLGGPLMPGAVVNVIIAPRLPGRPAEILSSVEVLGEDISGSDDVRVYVALDPVAQRALANVGDSTIRLAVRR